LSERGLVHLLLTRLVATDEPPLTYTGVYLLPSDT
jgi:hypothetical protein